VGEVSAAWWTVAAFGISLALWLVIGVVVMAVMAVLS
jgi:hypothetical protein